MLKVPKVRDNRRFRVPVKYVLYRSISFHSISPAKGKSFDESGRFVLRPGIIRNAQANTITNGRMVEEKKNLERIRVGIYKNFFAVVLERESARLSGIRNDAVSDFQAVDIGLIFLVAAKCAASNIGRETEHENKK